ncbi:hypothetical protein [Planktothrix tepida]|nr:hypothetical protein [Planktothrix tepida]
MLNSEFYGNSSTTLKLFLPIIRTMLFTDMVDVVIVAKLQLSNRGL